MDIPFALTTFARSGLLNPGPPLRILRQVAELRWWGLGLGGQLRSDAARDPHRIGIVDDDGRYTYAGLLERAEHFAAGLRDQMGISARGDPRAGDPPGEPDRVGFLCRNHVGLVTGVAATSLLGADAVLVNAGLSAAQVAALAAEQRLRALVHDSELRGRTEELPDTVERIDESGVDTLTRNATSGRVCPPPHPGHTIVLTAGTTGLPKGARRPNPGRLAVLAGILDRIPVHTRDRILIAAPIFHAWGYGALQLTLAMRGTAVLSRHFDPAATLTSLAANECAALFAVPMMLNRLLEAGPPERRPTRLRVVAVSGSALPSDLARHFMDEYGDVLYNLYGSTEASWASIATPADLRRAPATAGRPPHGTRVEIVDGNGDPMPRGRTGRILVGNDMLVDRYTSGASTGMHKGMLATGDLGHIDADGLVFVDGRQDDMIVSGGENVSAFQVEDLLARLPQVREVAVTGVPDKEFGQRLAAWIALRPGARLNAEQVREHVRRNLARFSVPRDVRFVDSLPRNAIGKVVPRLLPS
jgi:acyl-CoA synthetase (AMP-forming)/AMP-acid ligase II